MNWISQNRSRGYEEKWFLCYYILRNKQLLKFGLSGSSYVVIPKKKKKSYLNNLNPKQTLLENQKQVHINKFKFYLSAFINVNIICPFVKLQLLQSPICRCGPCQYMGPILDQVSVSLKDKIQVVKIDTEKYTSVADKYRIQALPTFIIFKDGEPCDRFVSQNDY